MTRRQTSTRNGRGEMGRAAAEVWRTQRRPFSPSTARAAAFVAVPSGPRSHARRHSTPSRSSNQAGERPTKISDPRSQVARTPALTRPCLTDLCTAWRRCSMPLSTWPTRLVTRSLVLADADRVDRETQAMGARRRVVPTGAAALHPAGSARVCEAGHAGPGYAGIWQWSGPSWWARAG
jgi:hypothetical protein